MSAWLAIDQSTSATKALLFDAAYTPIDRAARDHRQLHPAPGRAEHDAEEIWNNTLEVIREVAARNPETAIQGLALTNQRETFVLFERETGTPVAPAVTWQCRRGIDVCSELAEPARDAGMEERTGLRLDTYFPAPKLVQVMRENPALAGRVQRGEVLFGTIDTYLIYRLTEGRVFATDATNASRTLLYNIRDRAWDPTLCTLFGIPIEHLAAVRDCSAAFGETRAGGALDAPIPIRGVMGDSQASLLGHSCTSAGACKVTFGTGSSLMLNIGDQPMPPAGGAVTSLAWILDGRPAYALEALINYSAATLNWLRDQLGIARDIDELERMAARVEDNGGVYLVPAFAGLSAPHWAPRARAAIVGLSAHSERAHIARAAVESIALQIADAVEILGHESGVPVAALHADGGPTRNRLLMQLTASLAGVPLRVNRVPDISPLGALIAGRSGAGEAPPAQDPDAFESYTPDLPAGQVRTIREGWNRAVQQVLAGIPKA